MEKQGDCSNSWNEQIWFKDIWTTNYSVNLGYVTYKGGVFEDPTSMPVREKLK